MGIQEDLIFKYLDDCGIQRKWKGYRLLYEAISIFMEDSSLDCNSICEKICMKTAYQSYRPRSIYTTSLYAIKRSNDSLIQAKSVYQFLVEAGIDIKRSLVPLS